MKLFICLVFLIVYAHAARDPFHAYDATSCTLPIKILGSSIEGKKRTIYCATSKHDFVEVGLHEKIDNYKITAISDEEVILQDQTSGTSHSIKLMAR